MSGVSPELYDSTPEFRPWGKTPRFFDLHCVVTEKIDGTNALIHITDDGRLYPGSRNRWLQPGKKTDNFGFATFCEENREELMKLGPGWHYGEWWGRGIGPRGYGFHDAAHSEYANQGRFLSLFNTRRWGAHNPTTPRERFHKVSSIGTSWVLSFRSEWSPTWVDRDLATGETRLLGHGRKELCHV